MKKVLLISICLLLLTGCGSSKLEEYSVNYDLKITNIFVENITVSLPKNAYSLIEKDKDVDDSPVPIEYTLLKEDIYPIFSNQKIKYKKNIKKYNNAVDVTLAYNYPEKYFVYNNLITACFENYDLISGDDSFEVKLSGRYSCGDQIKKLNVNIDSKYKVIESNGKKNGSSYSWSFDSKDFSNISINYKIARDYKKMALEASNSSKGNNRNTVIRNLRIAIIAIMVFVVIGFVIRFYFMRKEEY